MVSFLYAAVPYHEKKEDYLDEMKIGIWSADVKKLIREWNSHYRRSDFFIFETVDPIEAEKSISEYLTAKGYLLEGEFYMTTALSDFLEWSKLHGLNRVSYE